MSIAKFLIVLNASDQAPAKGTVQALIEFWKQWMDQLCSLKRNIVNIQFWQISLFWGKVFPLTVLLYVKKNLSQDEFMTQCATYKVDVKKLDNTQDKRNGNSTNITVDCMKRLVQTCSNECAPNLPLLSFDRVLQAACAFVDDRIQLDKPSMTLLQCCCMMKHCFDCSNMFLNGFDTIYASYSGQTSKTVAESMQQTISATDR